MYEYINKKKTGSYLYRVTKIYLRNIHYKYSTKSLHHHNYFFGKISLL